jgi:hypothetical protein
MAGALWVWNLHEPQPCRGRRSSLVGIRGTRPHRLIPRGRGRCSLLVAAGLSRVFPMVPPSSPCSPSAGWLPQTTRNPHISPEDQQTLGAEGQSSSTIVSKRFHHRIVLSSRRYLFHALYCSLVRSLYPFLDLGGKRHQLVGRLNLGTFGTILYLAIRTDRPRQ